jgi:membrane-associated phospholipid phosphatase
MPFLSSIKTNKKTRTYVLVALASIMIGALMFGFLYDNVREQNDVARLDGPTLTWMISHRTDAITTVMQAITFIASPFVLASLIGGSLIWAWRKRELWRPALLIGAMGLAVATSSLIKQIVGRGRPPFGDMVLPLEIDFSFPSGHTIGITVLMLVGGYLLYSRRPTIKTLVVWILATVFAVSLVAGSRLYLAYHWVTDVSASIGLALIILGIIILVDLFLKDKKVIIHHETRLKNLNFTKNS